MSKKRKKKKSVRIDKCSQCWLMRNPIYWYNQHFSLATKQIPEYYVYRLLKGEKPPTAFYIQRFFQRIYLEYIAEPTVSLHDYFKSRVKLEPKVRKKHLPDEKAFRKADIFLKKLQYNVGSFVPFYGSYRTVEGVCDHYAPYDERPTAFYVWWPVLEQERVVNYSYKWAVLRSALITSYSGALVRQNLVILPFLGAGLKFEQPDIPIETLIELGALGYNLGGLIDGTEPREVEGVVFKL